MWFQFDSDILSACWHQMLVYKGVWGIALFVSLLVLPFVLSRKV